MVNDMTKDVCPIYKFPKRKLSFNTCNNIIMGCAAIVVIGESWGYAKQYIGPVLFLICIAVMIYDVIKDFFEMKHEVGLMGAIIGGIICLGSWFFVFAVLICGVIFLNVWIQG